MRSAVPFWTSPGTMRRTCDLWTTPADGECACHATELWASGCWLSDVCCWGGGGGRGGEWCGCVFGWLAEGGRGWGGGGRGGVECGLMGVGCELLGGVNFCVCLTVCVYICGCNIWLVCPSACHMCVCIWYMCVWHVCVFNVWLLPKCLMSDLHLCI